MVDGCGIAFENHSRGSNSVRVLSEGNEGTFTRIAVPRERADLHDNVHDRQPPDGG